MRGRCRKLEFSADYSVELIKDSFDLPFIVYRRKEEP